MLDTRETQQLEPIYVIMKCKGCKKVRRITIEREAEPYLDYSREDHDYTIPRTRINYSYQGEPIHSRYGSTVIRDKQRGTFSMTCSNRCDEKSYHRLTGKPTTGHVTTQTCNAKCMSATGPTCECSCGGTNHGGRFAE